jgi:hypothetical protein
MFLFLKKLAIKTLVINCCACLLHYKVDETFQCCSSLINTKAWANKNQRGWENAQYYKKSSSESFLHKKTPAIKQHRHLGVGRGGWLRERGSFWTPLLCSLLLRASPASQPARSAY